MQITLSSAACYLLALVLMCTIASAEEAPYQIDEQGHVDIYTHVGWKVFNMSCYVCHGVDATGSDVAPDLRESLKTMDRKTFVTKVLTRYRMTVELPSFKPNKQSMRDEILAQVANEERAQHGDIIMPAWSDNPYVQPHVTDIYAYLKARSDGAIGTGEPPVIHPSP